MEQMVMATNSFSTLLGNAAGDCWLALNDDETAIVGRGGTPAEAVEEAKRSGVNDPVLLWAPKKWIPSVFR
jgi:hypothetical protein